MENNWEKIKIDLGRSYVGKEQKIIFKALKELPKIIRISPSCGCTVANYSLEKRELQVSFKPNSFPKHLKDKEFYVSHKVISISFVDGTKDVLSFNSKVYEK